LGKGRHACTIFEKPSNEGQRNLFNEDDIDETLFNFMD